MIGDLTLCGVVLAPSQDEPSHGHACWSAAAESDAPDPRLMPRPAASAFPVFADASGRTFVLASNADGETIAYPFLLGAPIQATDDAAGNGGMIRLGDLPTAPADPLQERITNSAAAAADNSHDDKRGSSDGGSAATSQQIGQFASMAVANIAGGGPLAGVLSAASSIVAPQGSGVDLGALAKSGLSMGLGAAANFGMQQALGELFAFADGDAGPGEHMAAEVGRRVVAELQAEVMARAGDAVTSAVSGVDPASSPSMLDKAKEFFGGVSSSASIEVARVGDPNSAKGEVKSGAATVLVEGAAAARMNDTASMTQPLPDAGPLQTGNPTIEVEGQPLSGVGHVAVGNGAGIDGVVEKGAATVLMGPQGMPVHGGEQATDPAGQQNEKPKAPEQSNDSGGDEQPELDDSKTHDPRQEHKGDRRPDGPPEEPGLESKMHGPEGADKVQKKLNELEAEKQRKAAKQDYDAAKAKSDVATRDANAARTKADTKARIAQEQAFSGQNSREFGEAHKSHVDAHRADIDAKAKSHYADQLTQKTSAAEGRLKGIPNEVHVPSKLLTAADGLGKAVGVISFVEDGADILAAHNRGDQRGVVVESSEMVGSMAGGSIGGKAGAVAGAWAGSFVFPVVGTVLGGLIGGFVGSFAGGEAGSALGKHAGNKAADYYDLAPSPPPSM